MKRNAIRLMTVAASLLLLAGCIPTSKHPITKPGGQKIDPEILGTWYFTEDGTKKGYLHIGTDRNSSVLRVLMVDFNAKNRLKTTEMIGHTSQLKKGRYLNLKSAKPEEKKDEGYLFISYHIDAQGLGIGMIDTSKIKKMIKENKLAGEVGKEKFLPSIRITESSAKLQSFMEKNGKSVFSEMKYLKRLDLLKQPKKQKHPKQPQTEEEKAGKSSSQ